ncbi:MAG: hypothetical protein IPN90_01105 [Elusimicrobia bacterium]|nr:hypothetical protein [Elusimicrobiota bacterium]
MSSLGIDLILHNHYTMDVITGAAMAFAVCMTLNRWWPNKSGQGLTDFARGL